MKRLSKIYLILTISLLVIGLFFLFFSHRGINKPATEDLLTKANLLIALKNAAVKEDYQNFAKYLKMVYQNLWENDQDFLSIESAAYVKATSYFEKGEINKALEIADIVYNEVPQGWRFRYLRIVCLEKIGRNALNQNDLAKAEEYATKILQMMYRPEGVNLLADVYIKKIETSLVAGDKKSAFKNLNYIWDFEVSQDRRDKLTQLKNQIETKP